ncbi:protein LNK1 isoform X3 [Dioscorea cayenensis subsp. rotundata]|uniref:Protein LNK1 isoform X3 n=1 Tax=Dioscorea cayennensis subsp. rotundata TaxID=55577 RepID=A0AB40CXV7_DIOCR|nr:protein LNK1 isoform X3 [Dioscorea cayenensis subsp. rotundata]
MMRIQDWSMHELEDIICENFGKSGDHVVPLWCIQQVDEILEALDVHRQLGHRIGSVGKSANSGRSTGDTYQTEDAGSFHPSSEVGSNSMLDGSWSQESKGPAPATNGTKCTANVSALTSQNVIILDKCGEGNKIDSVCNTIYLKDAAFGTQGTPDDYRGCNLSPADSSSRDTNVGFLENDKDKDVDLMDYDWPDDSNMEDIDRLFRNCNSTFAQGSTSYADEPSWLAGSSHGGYALTGVNSNFSLKNDLLAAYDDKPPTIGNHTYAEWLDSNVESEWNYSTTKQANDGNDCTKVSAITQLSNENILFGSEDKDVISVHAKPPESHYVFSEKARIQHSDCNNSNLERRHGKKRPLAEEKIETSAASGHQNYSSHFSDQEHYSGPTSNPLGQMEYDLLTHQVPFSLIRSSDKFDNESHPPTSYKALDHLICDSPQRFDCLDHHLSKPASMATQEDIDNQQTRQQLSEVLMAKLPSQQNSFTSAIQKKYPKHSQLQCEISDSNLLVDRNSGHPVVEMDVLTAHEGSCLTSDLSDDSLKETSFWQLHHVMDLLDIRTTLSLRDGLYRLAKSAEQRHGFTCANSPIRASKCTGSCSTENLQNYAGYMDTETNTNPIDRAIAHLLFYGPSDSVSRPTSDAASIKFLPHSSECCLIMLIPRLL